MKKLLIVLIILFTLTGCDYMELNDLAIVSALGIDYKDGKYEITAQVVNVKSAEAGNMEEESLIYEADGKTIGKAISNLSEKYPKTAYFEHLEIIVLGKDVVDKKINDIFDYVMRSPEVRADGYVLVNKYQSARETLKPDNEKKNSFATEQIKSTIKNTAKTTGTVSILTFEELLQKYLEKGLDPVVPLIKINDDNSNVSKTIISNIVPVANSKIGKELSKEEAISYNTIMNNYKSTIITPEYNNEPFGALVFNPKSNIKTIIKNGKITVYININVETKINEINNKVDINNDKTRKELESIIENELFLYTVSLVNYCKDNSVDILGIGNSIYKNHYKEFNNYKNKNLYKISDINIKVKSKMYRSGTTNKGAI